MIEWEQCVLEDGIAAEFPMDFLSPSVAKSNEGHRVFYWDQDLLSRISYDTNNHILTVPTYEIIDNEAKNKMEDGLSNPKYRYQAVEVISEGKTGLAIFETVRYWRTK